MRGKLAKWNEQEGRWSMVGYRLLTQSFLALNLLSTCATFCGRKRKEAQQENGRSDRQTEGFQHVDSQDARIQLNQDSRWASKPLRKQKNLPQPLSARKLSDLFFSILRCNVKMSKLVSIELDGAAPQKFLLFILSKYDKNWHGTLPKKVTIEQWLAKRRYCSFMSSFPARERGGPISNARK